MKQTNYFSAEECSKSRRKRGMSPKEGEFVVNNA